MIVRMTTIVIGPDDKISGTVQVSPPPDAPAAEVLDDADDTTEEEPT
jgi:hypothetical protein